METLHRQRVARNNLATDKPVALEFPIGLEFRSVGFVEGGKPENPKKNPRSRDENQQQTEPTYDAGSGNRTRATLVGSECSHHCAIPAPSTSLRNRYQVLGNEETAVEESEEDRVCL